MQGQLNIDIYGKNLQVTLRNYPTPKDSENPEGQQMPTPLWKHPDKSELQETPPVYNEESDKEEDLILIKRELDDVICGFELKNFDDHRDLMHLRTEEDGEVNLDFVKVDVPRM